MSIYASPNPLTGLLVARVFEDMFLVRPMFLRIIVLAQSGVFVEGFVGGSLG
jgi:hypothetical protein